MGDIHNVLGYGLDVGAVMFQIRAGALEFIPSLKHPDSLEGRGVRGKFTPEAKEAGLKASKFPRLVQILRMPRAVPAFLHACCELHNLNMC
jgi:hypothetical protein